MVLIKWINEEVESRFISSLLLSKEAWHTISSKFNPNVFAVEEYYQVAEIIKKIAVTGQEPTNTRVYIEARKQGIDTKKILNLDRVVITNEIKDLNELLIDLYRRRLVLSKLKEAVHTIETGDQDTDVIIATAQDALLNAFKEDRKDVIDWQGVLDEVHHNQILAQEGKLEDAIPLGLDALDGILRLMRGRQVIIAARPSMGKSAIAMNIIKSVAKKGKRVILFTPEQEDSEFAIRSLAAELTIPANYFGAKMDDASMDKLNDGLSKVYNWPIRIMDRPKPTIDQIKTITRAEKSRYPDLDLMVVDYLGECDVEERKYGGLQQATGRAISELRALAKELNIAQVVLSQLNRGLENRENKRPIMADLRESGRIEEVADAIFFLYRNGYYHPGFMQDEYCNWITEIKCAKDRQGGSAGRKVIAHLNSQYLRFERMQDEYGRRYVDFLQKTKA